MNDSRQFSVRGLRLPATEAIAKIQADDTIPDADKAHIVLKIQKTGFAGVIVDAHEHCNEGETYHHFSIKKLY